MIVQNDWDMKRILALPTQRPWMATQDYTDEYKTENGEWRFNDVQNEFIKALVQAKRNKRGLWCDIEVGGGKSLCSLIAGSVMKSQRILLLVPANLRVQTLKYVIPEQSKHFKIRVDKIKVMSYTALSSSKNASFLDDYNPDLIVCDEAHKLKAIRASRVRRFKQYILKNPNTKCIFMSGSFYKSGIKDITHLMQWALKEGSPLPIKWMSQLAWSRAVDASVPWHLKYQPGALKLLKSDPSQTYREAIQERIYKTPGVLRSTGAGISVGLEVHKLKLPRIPKEVKEALDTLEELWIRPDGKELELASEVARLRKQLIQGYYTYWLEEPPKSWLRARTAFSKACNAVTRNSKTVDSELLFKQKYPQSPAVKAWARECANFQPKVGVRWISDYLCVYAEKWAKKNKGIVWVTSPHIGAKINLPYYGGGNSKILEHKGPCVASILAHGTGKNLQQFSEALVLVPVVAGDQWEQLLGRHHRFGQEADTVTFSVFTKGHKIVSEMWNKGYQSAEMIQQFKGAKQKLIVATKIEK